jgi:hypothetical protein
MLSLIPPRVFCSAGDTAELRGWKLAKKQRLSKTNVIMETLSFAYAYDEIL